MKRMNLNFMIIGAVCLLFAFTGCQKDFLEKKPASTIILPTTLDDFQALMENVNIHGVTSELPLLASDELEYISFAVWQSVPFNLQKNSYIWAEDLFQSEVNSAEWRQSYGSIFYCNNVLAGLKGTETSAQTIDRFRFLKGWALFCRAYAYFELAKNFSPSYDVSASNDLLGVPLKLNPSIDEVEQRSTQKETYERILIDLTEATSLLSGTLPVNRNRPSKISCHALAARIYLSMNDYINAERHADSTLLLYRELVDYNSVSLTSSSPFTTINTELLYQTASANTSGALNTIVGNSFLNIPDNIIKLYDRNDLRLPIYFAKRPTGTSIRKRGYQKSGSNPFTGLATDEIYLIKSECAARRGDVTVSLKYLNDLLIKRYKSGTYKVITIADQAELLAKVLLERQKELVWRGLRWDDLKRLNKSGANITLTRVLNGQTYTLLPNDPRYVFPIPDNEINQSGIQQNLR